MIIQDGFENSTGMFINVIPPEIAAQSLRDSIEEVEKMAKLVEIIVMAATKRKYKCACQTY